MQKFLLEHEQLNRFRFGLILRTWNPNIHHAANMAICNCSSLSICKRLARCPHNYGQQKLRAKCG